MKARYLAVNTPESTGKIEEWGKKASNFTKSKLQSATSIVLETDGANWEVDSTGDRHLVWVWYKTADSDVYRNLNLELLQNGLALSSKSSETRYGEAAVKAINQATQLKLHVFSKEKDPDFYYGQAYEIDLKELRMNIEEYSGLKVAFEGYVSYYNNQGVYVESYDEVTDMYYGIYVYYGFFLSSYGEKVLSEGNHVRIVGSVQYWETGGSYQVADLTYDPFDLENPNNIQLLDKEKHPAANHETDAAMFNGKVQIDVTQKNEDGEEIEVTKTVDYAEMALGTSISMKGLRVVKAYTTKNGGDNDGAMTLTCQDENGQTVDVRTIVLKNADGNVITEDYYLGKTIDVSGIVDYFDGDYQIKVFRTSSIVIVE